MKTDWPAAPLLNVQSSTRHEARDIAAELMGFKGSGAGEPVGSSKVVIKPDPELVPVVVVDSQPEEVISIDDVDAPAVAGSGAPAVAGGGASP